jgi:hypothetical protein
MLWSLGIIVSHAISWLKLGYWPSYAVWELQDDVFGRRLESSWVGIQRLILWWQSTSAANSLFWIGMALACWGGWLIEEGDRAKEQERQRAWKAEQEEQRTAREAKWAADKERRAARDQLRDQT